MGNHISQKSNYKGEVDKINIVYGYIDDLDNFERAIIEYKNIKPIQFFLFSSLNYRRPSQSKSFGEI